MGGSIIATFSLKSKMSTSSSTTAFGRDPVPTDNPTLKARMCVFIIMQKDGTPFDVTSVTEEDIVQLISHIEAHSPLGCAPVFGNGVSSFILHGRRDAAGITWCHKSNRVMQ